MGRMAPPGTYLNAVPQFPNSQREAIFEDSDSNFITDSDEEAPQSRHDIPSAIVKPPQPRGINSLSSTVSDNSFIFDRFNIRPVASFSSGRSTPPSQDTTVDLRLLNVLKRVRSVLPDHAEADIISAVRKKNYNADDAITWLMEGRESSSKKEPVKTGAPKGVASSTLNNISKLNKFHARDSKQSIAQKYAALKATRSPTSQQPKSQTHASAQVQYSSQSLSQDAPIVRKRKLVQVRKRSPTPDYQDDDVVEIANPNQATKPKGKRLVQGRRHASPDEEDIEEIAAFARPKQKIQLPVNLSDESDVESQQSTEPADDEDLLEFFNSCDAHQLADLATTNEADAAYIISKRPFCSLDEIREIETEQEPPKNAKRRAPRRKPIGDKVLDATEKMWRGLKAIDLLVKECDTLNARVQSGMERLGIRIKNNEVDASKLETESRTDSGLGTPISNASRYLNKPAIMSNDLDLKSHQLVGLNWLNLLYSEGISAILADDMGLGKTCQVIAFLSHLAEQDDMGRHLIIVPGSTLENWMREFARFSPSISVYPYHGSHSERLSMQDEIWNEGYDVILTTYDMATKKDDNKFFRKLAPRTIVFDEGHMLKNKTSNRFQQLIRIQTPWRLLLTGTPLQNNLLELVSILNFMMPDMFKDQAGEMDVIFKHKAKTTDEEHSALLSAQRVARARQMMAPFILRRKKEHVDSALPPKTRRIEYCDMATRQQQVYDDYTEIHREALRNRLNGITSIPQNYLMDRRKAAIHPLLFRYLYTNDDIEKMHKKVPREKGIYKGWSAIKMKEEMEWWSDFKIHQLCLDTPSLNRFALEEGDCMESGKITAVLKLLEEFDQSGSRALLFSQFTMVLDILESVFNSKGIKFLRLDGNTPIAARQDWIDKFHQDESYKVFMLSTRSGGTGINLACANKVIIFDASFNPQDDMQAENRAHRFGQTREVEIIRLISRGTVEEQIHTLCEGKLALEGAVTGEELEKKNIEMMQRILAEEEDSILSAQTEAAAAIKEKKEIRATTEGNGSSKQETEVETVSRIGGGKDEVQEIKEEMDIRDAFTKSLKAAGVNVQE